MRAWGRGDVFRGAAFRRARARTLGNGERKVLYTSCAALWRRFSCLCSVGAPFLAQRRTNGWHSGSGTVETDCGDTVALVVLRSGSGLRPVATAPK